MNTLNSTGNAILNGLGIMLIIAFVFFLIGAFFMFRDAFRALDKRDELFNKVKNCKSPQEWVTLKEEINQFIASQYKKSYKERETHGTLHAALTDKAEEILNETISNGSI